MLSSIGTPGARIFCGPLVVALKHFVHREAIWSPEWRRVAPRSNGSRHQFGVYYGVFSASFRRRLGRVGMPK